MTNLLSTFQKIKDQVSPMALQHENASIKGISSEDNPFNDKLHNFTPYKVLQPSKTTNSASLEENPRKLQFLKTDNLHKVVDSNSKKLDLPKVYEDPPEQQKASAQQQKKIEENSKKIEEDEDEVPLKVLEEMNKLEECFPILSSNYRLIDKIGEGTFSTVYKAEALNGAIKLGSEIWKSPPLKRQKFNNSEIIKKPKKSKNPIVALKQIYVTSSPNRIYNELNLLYILTGNSHIAPLLDVLRYQDQVVAILPYYPHADFRDFYRDLPVQGIKKYLWELFQGLEFVHTKGIIHRDLKPTNFLYDPFKGKGVLVDFGLAEKVSANHNKHSNMCPCDSSSTSHDNGTTKELINKNRHHNKRLNIKAAYPKQDQRPPRRANRAGTRGFRAPEVLFKCNNQTSKLDIWSAGIIGLSMLARKFPLLNSPDDTDALVELAILFGIENLTACGELHGCGLEINLDHLSNHNPNDGNIIKLIYIFLKYEIEKNAVPRKSAIYDTYKLFDSQGDAFVKPTRENFPEHMWYLAAMDDYEDHMGLMTLLTGCLEMDASKRLTAKQVLKLPFFKELSQDYDDDVIL